MNLRQLKAANAYMHVLQERQRLMDTPITLNGNPARISRTNDNVAVITDLTTGLSAQWSWSAVAHVITTKEGKFTS